LPFGLVNKGLKKKNPYGFFAVSRKITTFAARNNHTELK